MGNEPSSQKLKRLDHSVHGDDLKKDFPTLTDTFNEHATKVVGGTKYLTETNLTNSLFAKIPEFGSAFFTKYCDGEELSIGLTNFLTIGSQFSSLGLNSCSEHLIKFYARMFSSNEQTLNKDELLKFIKVSIQSSLVTAKLDGTSINLDQILLSFIDTVFQQVVNCEEGEITLGGFCSWSMDHVPLFVQDLHDHVVYRLTKRTTAKKNVAGRNLETVEESDIFGICCANNSTIGASSLWLVCHCAPQFFIPSSQLGTISNFSRILENNGWHVLYDSNSQGLSANGFSNKVLGYPGPTLTYFRFGACLLLLGLDVDWRESHKKIGSYNSFLYQLLPTFKVVQSGGEECLQFNLTNRTVRRGMQCGQNKKISLELDEDFNKISYDMQTSSLSRLEVWGCGGSSNYEKYASQKQWEKRDTAKLKDRKLRPEDWKDNPDKALLGYGGIETDHAKRGDL